MGLQYGFRDYCTFEMDMRLRKLEHVLIKINDDRIN